MLVSTSGCGVSKKLRESPQLDPLPWIEVQSRLNPKSEVSRLACAWISRCTFVLQLHVGAQGINARADAFLLPVRRLIVERLRQVDSRLRSLHVRHVAQRTDVLRHHQQNHLLA